MGSAPKAHENSNKLFSEKDSKGSTAPLIGLTPVVPYVFSHETILQILFECRVVCTSRRTLVQSVKHE